MINDDTFLIDIIINLPPHYLEMPFTKWLFWTMDIDWIIPCLPSWASPIYIRLLHLAKHWMFHSTAQPKHHHHHHVFVQDSLLHLRSQTNIEYFIESAFHPPPFPIIRLWHFQYPSLLDNTWISSPLRLCRQHHHLFLSLSYIAPDVAYPDSDAGLWCNEQIVQRWVWQIRRYAMVHPTYTTVCDAPRRSHHVNLTHPSYPCRYSCKPLWNAYLPLCTRSRCTWINVPWMEIYGCNPWDDLVFTLFDHTCLTTHGIKISEILLDQEFHICNALTKI